VNLRQLFKDWWSFCIDVYHEVALADNSLSFAQDL
jgi:hypothetical protein